VERRAPQFDVAEWERNTRDEINAWGEGAKARRLWNAVRVVLAKAVDYVDTHPSARGAHVGKLRGLLETPCQGNADTTLRPLRERLVYWGRDSKEERRLLGVGRSIRTALVMRYADQANSLWWQGKPSVRDLAMVSLLAGNIPEAAETLQRGARGLRPLEVVALEEKAVEKLLKRRPNANEIVRLARAVQAKAKVPPR
jgi:hypothetical protein